MVMKAAGAFIFPPERLSDRADAAVVPAGAT
jgi:hypothetical protein